MILVSSPCFRDLAELKFILKNMHLISYHFCLSAWWISQQAYHRKWYLDVVNLNYFYGDPICNLTTIVETMRASSHHQAWLWASSFQIRCGDFWGCRLILMLAKRQGSYGKISTFLLFQLTFMAPPTVASHQCHGGLMSPLDHNVAAKQDITFQRESIQIKSEPFSGSPLKMTV